MNSKITDLKNKLLAIRFLRFFLSGGLSFVIDTAILISIKAVVFNGVDYKIFDTISVAKLISGTVGIILMFTLNRLWVFAESKESSIKKQGSKYIAVTVVNLLLASVLFSFFTTLVLQVMGDGFASHITITITLANLLTEGTKMIVSFFAYKYLVFR